MKLVIISDTHGRHDELGTLRGDVLIHCGDSGNGFSRHPDDLDRLDAWFGQQEFERILCIGGNHDFDMQARAERGGPVLRNAEYLQDQVHEYRSVRFYGSPWTPELVGWADRNTAGRNPRIHCFGHIHASAGTTNLHGTTYVNASMANSRYEIAHQPIEFNV